jgi:hypothetical protein
VIDSTTWICCIVSASPESPKPAAIVAAVSSASASSSSCPYITRQLYATHCTAPCLVQSKVIARSLLTRISAIRTVKFCATVEDSAPQSLPHARAALPPHFCWKIKRLGEQRSRIVARCKSSVATNAVAHAGFADGVADLEFAREARATAELHLRLSFPHHQYAKLQCAVQVDAGFAVACTQADLILQLAIAN